MGIDLATWRARIGFNYCRQYRYACRPLPVQWRAARWGVGELMNSTPFLLQGCMAVVSLSLLLGYTFHGRPIGRCGCGKVCRPKLRGGSVPSAVVGGMTDTGIIGVCLLLGVCAVVLALLLMAGDVERNPDPTGKEGRQLLNLWLCFKMFLWWSNTCCLYNMTAIRSLLRLVLKGMLIIHLFLILLTNTSPHNLYE